MSCVISICLYCLFQENVILLQAHLQELHALLERIGSCDLRSTNKAIKYGLSFLYHELKKQFAFQNIHTTKVAEKLHKNKSITQKIYSGSMYTSKISIIRQSTSNQLEGSKSNIEVVKTHTDKLKGTNIVSLGDNSNNVVVSTSSTPRNTYKVSRIPKMTPKSRRPTHLGPL